MPNSAATNKMREIFSDLRTTGSTLFRRRRRSKEIENRVRRSNNHESTSSNFSSSGPDADAAADRVIGRFLSEEEEDDNDYDPHQVDNDDNDSFKDSLDETRRGGDILTPPTSISMTYAPNPSSTMTTTGTGTFLSFGVQPLAPPAVSTRRASMGAYYRPTYVSDPAVPATTDGGIAGRTMNRRGTVPPMGTSVAAVDVGGYLSSTVDRLVAGHDPATAGLDIGTSNHHLYMYQDQDHHQSSGTFLIDHPSTSCTNAHHDKEREERRRIFEAKRSAEMTRNPRFL